MDRQRNSSGRTEPEGGVFIPVRQRQAGRVVDFHCLRHTFVSQLVKAGVSPKEPQTLARHSTITLTLDRYAHIRLYDAASAIKSLPSRPQSERPQVRELGVLPATGTDPGGFSGAAEGDNRGGVAKTGDETRLSNGGGNGPENCHEYSSEKETTGQLKKIDERRGRDSLNRCRVLNPIRGKLGQY